MVVTQTAAKKVSVVVNRVVMYSAGSDSTSGRVIVNGQLASYVLLERRNSASVILGVGSYVKVSGTNYDFQLTSGFETSVK